VTELTAEAHPQGYPPAHPRRWFLLGLLCLVQFMLLLDDTVVNVALPSIQKSLGFSVASLAWVVNAYVLVFGGLILLGGRLADLYGRRLIFLLGTGLFAVASLLNGVAQTQSMLIGSRALQGLGAALASPAALAMIAVLFSDPKERSTAVGVWGGLTALGGTTGVVLSGVLTDLVSWRWIFFINLPIAAIPLILVPMLATESRRRVRQRFDVLGAVTVTLATSAVVYGLLETVSRGWRDSRVITSLVLGIVLFAVFILVELRVRNPIIPLSFFRNRRAATADALQLLMASALFGTFFLLTLYLQQVLGYSPLRTGLTWLGFFVGIGVGFGVGSPLVPKIGVRPFMVSGFGLLAVGMFWFARVSANESYWTGILPGYLLMSVGIAFAALSITVAAVSDIPEEQAGLASGVLNSCGQVGGAVGLAALVTIASARTSGLVASGSPLRDAQLSGTHLSFAIGGAVLIVGALVAALLIGRLKPESVPSLVVLDKQEDTVIDPVRR
jgi:EmrB/QacA subfamily drug resistance transporter